MMDDATENFLVKVNGFEFHFTAEQIQNLDIISASHHQHHLIRDHQSFTATQVSADSTGKHQVIEMEGEQFHVQIRDQLDQMLDKMGFGAAAGRQVKEVKAPMPGLVLQVHVSEGQEVKEGEKLLILVAMKMENTIAIHADATISKVHVQAGHAVEKGQILIELD